MSKTMIEQLQVTLTNSSGGTEMALSSVPHRFPRHVEETMTNRNVQQALKRQPFQYKHELGKELDAVL